MSVQKPSSLRGFIAAASLSTLLVSASAPAQESTETNNPQDQNTTELSTTPAKSYMSEATRKTYGKYIDFVAQYTPGLTFVVLTPDDLDAKLNQDELGALGNAAGCVPIIPIDTTEHGVNALLKMEVAQTQILDMLKSSAESDNPIIKQDILVNTLYNNPLKFTQTVTAAAASALTGEAASVSFDREIVNETPLNFAIISMPTTFNKTEYAEGFAGISINYLDNLKATTEDWVLDILGHEIAGHAHNAHTGAELNAEYNCSIINSEWIDNSNSQESISDVIGSLIYRDAQKEGIVSNTNFAKEKESLRALGNLYIAPNSSSYANTADINDHVTTLVFDADAPDYISDLDHKEMNTLPATINRLADAISGYVSMIDFKKELKQNPENYHPEQRAYFESISHDPAHLEEELDKFALAGQEKRLGSPGGNGLNPVPSDPQWHYAAIAFIHKNNLLKTVKQETLPVYNQAIDDLIQDFLNAADRHGSKLKNPEIIQKMDNSLKAEDFKFLDFNSFLGVKTDSVDISPNQPEPGV
ncbi:MAG: hypothetical protein ACRBDI_09185 [Alphaproteobacteria bacterium]